MDVYPWRVDVSVPSDSDRTVIRMEASATPALAGTQRDPRHAPEHLVTWLSEFIEPAVPVGPADYPRGTPQHARRVQDQARVMADRVWLEGWVAAATYVAEIGALPQRFIVATPRDLFAYGRPVFDVEADEVVMPRSVAQPEDYRPQSCPLCHLRVDDVLVQSPAVAGAEVGPPERVVLKPCLHRITFIHDTEPTEGDNLWP